MEKCCFLSLTYFYKKYLFPTFNYRRSWNLQKINIRQLQLCNDLWNSRLRVPLPAFVAKQVKFHPLCSCLAFVIIKITAMSLQRKCYFDLQDSGPCVKCNCSW